MPDKAQQTLDDFQALFGYRFQDESRLRRALTHASAGAEGNYERLEFLGDRVLGLVMAELLFAAFPAESEGDLAKRHAALVSGETLARLSGRLALGEWLNLSAGERAGGGAQNDNILADVMEALIGAAYLDGGLPPCKTVIATLWADILHTMDTPPRDPKTTLQEWAQARGLPLPHYAVTARTGPDHAPVFTVAVTVGGFPPVEANGPSRRIAEKAAATNLLAQMEGRA